MTSLPLRLSANLKWLFTEWPFEDRFAAAAHAGFTAVEYASPYEYPAARLNTLLKQAGLRQVLINSPVPPGPLNASGIACHPDKVSLFRDGMLTALEYAEALSCPFVHLLGGVQPQNCSREQALSTYAENVEWASSLAAPAGIRVLLEAINQRDAPGFILHSVEQGAALISALGSEGVGLLFDVYHCQVQQGDITTRLGQLMPLIHHIQVADAPSRHEPGTGELAWGHVFDTLKRLGYRGHIGCEYRPQISTVQGLSWVKMSTAIEQLCWPFAYR